MLKSNYNSATLFFVQTPTTLMHQLVDQRGENIPT